MLIRRFQKLPALFGFRLIHQTSCAVKIERELACGKQQLIRMRHTQLITRNRQQRAACRRPVMTAEAQTSLPQETRAIHG